MSHDTDDPGRSARVVPDYSSERKRRIPLPNRKWTIRLTLTAVGIASLYFGTESLLTFLSLHRFEADVAARHARGEKVLKEDFVQPTIPQSDNAAYYIRRAGAAIQLSEDDGTLDQALSHDRPPDQADLKKLEGILLANAAVLENARRARLCSQTDWQLDYSRSPLSATLALGYLNRSREVAKLIACDAQVKHLKGDDAGALESLEDIVALSRSLDVQSALVSRLVSIGVLSLGLDQARAMAGTLRVGGSRAPGSAATRRQVDQLLGELTDDAVQRAAIAESWRGERMEAIDDAFYIARSMPVFRRYATYDDAGWVLGETDLIASAANAPSWNARTALLQRRSVPSGSAHVLANLLAGAWSRAGVAEFHIRTERRATAIVLAIRLYVIDHDGRLPPSLQSLSPAYLKSLPVDPYSPAGAPFRYRATATPAVYSVGENGVDDGGDVSLKSGYIWAEPDAVFPIQPSRN